MAYRDLKEFLKLLEEKNILKRIKAEIDPVLEIAEINDRGIKAGGPALLFENSMINVFQAMQEKTMYALWGTGQMSFTKAIVVVDK